MSRSYTKLHHLMVITKVPYEYPNTRGWLMAWETWNDESADELELELAWQLMNVTR